MMNRPLIAALAVLLAGGWVLAPPARGQVDQRAFPPKAPLPEYGSQPPAAGPGQAGYVPERGTGETDAAAPAPAAPGVTDALPPHPTPFFRGNGPEPAFVGSYLQMGLFVPTLLLFFGWVWSTNWVDGDAKRLKVRPEFWVTIVLVCGLLGFLALLLAPSFLPGAFALLLLYAVPLGLYINERNGRVPDSGKVMTPRHLKGLARFYLAKVGINLNFGRGGPVQSTTGPPITFLGKSTHGNKYDPGNARKVESSKGYVSAKELIYDSIMRRATDVHLEPQEDQTSVRVRIDGVMYPAEPFDRPTGDGIVNIFKVLSAMDITERRRPQDGSFRAELDDREVDFRVATQGTQHGEKMSLRILDQSGVGTSFKQLGMRQGLRTQVEELVKQPHGMVLCSGPTGAGKSTTLYACLNVIDRYQQNVITIEDPVEYRMEGVNQIEINTKSGQTFATSLRSVLRQDPDVVLLGEIRDKETAEVACQAANTGHMVYSTVHANDSITALFRLLELGIEPFMISNSLTALIGQRLVRRLCPDCKEAYQPKPELVKKAGLPVDKIDAFYRPPREAQGMCPRCGGLGYHGRVGVYELLTINERIRDLIREKASAGAVRAEAKKNGMLNMREEGLRLVVRGVTSIEELLRVVK